MYNTILHVFGLKRFCNINTLTTKYNHLDQLFSSVQNGTNENARLIAFIRKISFHFSFIFSQISHGRD